LLEAHAIDASQSPFAFTQTNASRQTLALSAVIHQESGATLREQSVVYYPEDLSLLGNAFDKAVAAIPAAMRTPFNRNVIARSILVQAAAGERDPIKLEQAALMNVGQIRAASDRKQWRNLGRPVLQQDPK
jgi:hypothetical protein